MLHHYLRDREFLDISTETVAVLASLEVVSRSEPRVAEAILAELEDQRRSLKLIASENHASLPVLLAMGNWLSDKYAEGSPGHRFYAGCERVDAIEQQAAETACQLFEADHAYLQPHSGIDANLVAFWAVLAARVEAPTLERIGVRHVNDLSDADWADLRQQLGNQKLMGMALDAGGHLTQGFRPNISGKLFDQRAYGVHPATKQVDYAVLREQAQAERPLILLAGISSYPRRLNYRVMREIADDVGAVLMVDMAHFAGLVAGGVLTGDFNPVPHAHVVMTTTHKTLRGPRGGMVLCTEEFADAVDRGCPLVLGGPLPHVMAAKAVALREASTPAFAEYAAAIVENAQALADGLLHNDLDVVSGGTDTHLVLVDVSSAGLTGRHAESALREVGITTNRNVVPFERNGAWYTSGIRLGTAALTTRGMTPSDMSDIAAAITEVLHATTPETINGTQSKARFHTDPAALNGPRTMVDKLTSAYPLYPEIDLSGFNATQGDL